MDEETGTRSSTTQSEEAEELGRFDRMALASLAELWDNEEDIIYDDWQKLYGVAEG